MSTLNFLYKREFQVNDKIKIYIPTVEEVLDAEDDYYGIVSMITSTPYDYMLALDEMGIDFTKINEFELFILLFEGIKKMKTDLVFKNLDLTKFKMIPDLEHERIVLYDKEDDITIDRMVHGKIAMAIRKIHGLEKNVRKPGNNEAREYLLQRARVKAKRKKRTRDSMLEQQIIALVNTEQFKYDFDSVRGMTIYQFNESVKQIQKKIDYDHKMFGIYTGNVDPKKMNQDELNWFIH